MRASFKKLGIGAACLFVLLVAFSFWLFGSGDTDIGRYKLGADVEVRLFIKADWDVGDMLYYSIRKDGQESVRTTYLTNHDREDRLQIHTAASADGSVVGLWADEEDVFVLYDLPSGESWPRLRDDEVSYSLSVKEKWRARYSLLRASHPELPVTSYFKETAN